MSILIDKIKFYWSQPAVFQKTASVLHNSLRQGLLANTIRSLRFQNKTFGEQGVPKSHKWAAAAQNQQSANVKPKALIRCATTAQLIRAFVFILYVSSKFQASSLLLWLYRLICVGPCRKPRLYVFCCGGSNMLNQTKFNTTTHSENDIPPSDTIGRQNRRQTYSLGWWLIDLILFSHNNFGLFVLKFIISVNNFFSHIGTDPSVPGYYPVLWGS